MNYLLIAVSVILIYIAFAIAYLIIQENKRRKNAAYIRDRRNGEIHQTNCSRVNSIPKIKRHYMDHWDLQHQKQISPTILKYCRKCNQ